MKKLALVAGLVLVASLALAPLAFAQDPVTKGVSAAAANAACAGIDGMPKPDGFDEAVKAYNTVANTDDAPFSAIPVEWQKFIIAVEDHKDYLDMVGLDNSKPITCAGKSADFPDLVFAPDVASAVCAVANVRLDVIASPALRARVDAALKALGRTYADARSDCPKPPATTAPTPAPTTTVTPPPATTTTTVAPSTSTGPPPPAPSDGFSQVRVVPQGGVDTGTR